MSTCTLPDMQCTGSNHNIAIHRVGIEDLKIPVFLSQQNGGQQHTVADVDVFVDLKGDVKGTHMSRLAIGVQKFMAHQLNADILKEICEYTRLKAEAEEAEVIYKFPYFIQKIAPASKEPGIVHCNVEFDVTTHKYLPGVIYASEPDVEEKGYSSTFVMTVETIATSCCPCSKEISDNGAHNQRSRIKIKCCPTGFVWIEDLIKIAEESASCEIYSVLKRSDEKYVTEKAYNNPAFVEDIVRHCSHLLDQRNDIAWYEIEVRNEESIHTHNAYAKIRSPR